MPDAIAIIEASMLADVSQLDVLSHNLANATTPGYKRDMLVTQWFGERLQQELGALEAQRGGLGETALPFAATRLTDHQPGSLRNTGEALHIALEGAGFLELASERGPVFSRVGALALDASGTLIGPGGLPVQGLQGDIRLHTLTPRIDRDGAIYEDDQLIDQLKLVRQDTGGTHKLGDGLFGASGAPTLAEPGQVRIRQGYLENSNVDSMAEMVRLIDTMRHFEASRQVVRGYDDMLQQALSTIGDL